MTSNPNPPVGASAALHAQRIREREAQADAGPSRRTGGRQTYEIYGERALAQARADEELRRRAEENDRRARAEREAADVPEVDGDAEQVEEAEGRVVDLTDNPERRSSRAAHRGVVAHAYQQAQMEGRGFIA
ncbi:hypothetical protein HKX69_30020 [Streptomyces argyrophyllae]|uniref:Uncharacterized protein n=1 Tax=Streptomyces argyrophylli TaxID=2726118 RepID=A0A6M4PU35_9ACTN|nr:hypothetical protein [Streptomyces argyrophyllae]QJS13216.1 hypothetical protein HKX69_30020 [Streptomyces argyrophyllae]